MPSGTGRSSAATVRRSGVAASSRAYCRTKNGLPPVRSATTASSRASCSPTEPCSSSPTAPVSSPSSRIRSAPARASAAIVSTSAGPVVASVVRRVQVTTTGARSPDPARWLSSRSDVASAQCRSSSTSNSGVSSAERCTSSTTASNIRRPVPPPLASPVSSPPRSGSSRGSAEVPGRSVGLAGEAADDAEPGPQRRCVVALVAATDEHPEPRGAGASAEVGDEPRLADAGLAGDQQEAHRAGRARLLQERHRLVEHGLAADRAGGCSGERRGGGGWNGRSGRGCGVVAGVGAVSAGSWRSTACSSRWISSDGSTPSSSARPSRSRRNVSSASACRAHWYCASASSDHSRSR